QVFSTAEDNQSAVTIHVLQGERKQASGNKSLGQFNLDGIAPAQRGMPQIEVTFDIDADGILHVSATDKATGKEQHITIKSSSGLSDEEVEAMVRDAATNAENDKKFEELQTVRNQADHMVHSVRKQLEEAGSQVPEEIKAPIEANLSELEEAAKGNDKDVIQAKIDELSKSMESLAAAAQAGSAQQGASQEQQSSTKSQDDAIDAEFEEK
ncbi:MAG: Hsp70 family protein, partial [Psittacicella sp.]